MNNYLSKSFKREGRKRLFYSFLFTRFSGRVIPSVFLTLILGLFPGEALAQRDRNTSPVQNRFGVVRSQENVRQWSSINQRLQQTGLDYCTVDLAEIRPGGTFNILNSEVGVLLLPNLETLTGAQVNALDTWMRRGGKVIVTGPAGHLSQPQIKTQLRSLFGAYWGFPLTSPSTLQIQTGDNPNTAGFSRLSTTVHGGAIIPTGTNSQTVATWQAQGTPPAVIITDRSTFLGWRWGNNEVASTEADSLWLQASLNRYGRFSPVTDSTGGSCGDSETIAVQPTTDPSPRVSPPRTTPPRNSSTPPRTNPPRTNPPRTNPPRTNPPRTNPPRTNPPRTTLPSTTPPSTTPAPTPADLRGLQQELERLQGRYESALLIAEANNQNAGISLNEVIEQVAEKSVQTRNNSFNAQLTEVREQLQTFKTLIQQGDFPQARNQGRYVRSLIWDRYPTEARLHYPETRGMWLDRGTIVRTRSKQELGRIFDRLANAGINTVFFETVNASYTIYPSEVAPEQNPLVQGWDPLEAAIELAHERGMELHAWTWIFAAANQRHNQILRQPQDYLGPVLTQHPDWVGTDAQGNPFQVNTKKAFFDPANPELRAYLLRLLDEIASKYDVDGIQLDYIRYPFQDPNRGLNYGFGAASRQAFYRLRGVDPAKLSARDPLWSDWTQFRVQQVDSFVGEVSELMRKKHPDIILSAAVFPIPTQDRLGRIQQHWEEWVRRDYLDAITPMTYADATDELQQLTQPILDENVQGSTLFLPGIRLLGLPTMVAIDQMQYLRDSQTEGYSLFAAENLSINLQTILRNTQGRSNSNSNEPIAHRQPLETALKRFEILQREWGLSLVSGQLQMDERAMREWGKQSKAVEIALTTLANSRSPENLRRATSALGTFRQGFGAWMGQQAREQPYQVQVWQNRLSGIDRLIRYGGRDR
ncbi:MULTISPECIES: family 10 glycosylhydrolase [Spirulina sp. CCY15215]|uniref:family 10 glycosylhydrolase n=1 Tax=Spirulina sp. CCY15215 TaxID=2767591 RepID=UPI0019501893|nr:family 10 glycosylhydrolase [Spirulina major]